MALGLCGVARCGFAIGQPWYVQTQSAPGAFALAQGKTAANVYVRFERLAGVIRAAGDLQDDIARVSGATAASGLGKHDYHRHAGQESNYRPPGA